MALRSILSSQSSSDVHNLFVSPSAQTRVSASARYISMFPAV